jgi:phospholipid/cholesterol/gamma-HCH transport system ATP-binding protein
MKKDKIISVENITVRFDEFVLIKNLSFDVYEDECVSIVGPSGCGKTILLKAIAGVIEIDEGKIELFGKDISKISKKEKYWINKETGFLFQNYALFDSMNVLDNVIFYMENHTKMEYKEMKDRAEFLLSIVGLEGTGDKFPSELSGGMKKRVGIIRAIIHKPKLLFLDEPVAGLDPISSDTITKIITKLKEKFSLTLLSISNELAYTHKISNRVGVMYEGKIYDIDDTEKVFSSKDPLINQFISGLKSGPIKY